MTSREVWSFHAAVCEGISIPSPPSIVGKANNAYSRLPGGGLPVMVGRRVDCKVSSSGLNRGPVPGVVQLRYVYLLISQCVKMVKVA